MPPGLWPQAGALVGLLALSAFFSSSETALFSLSLVQVRRLRDSGGRSGRAVAHLLAYPRRLLITILVGNMVVNAALASVVAAVATELVGNEGLAIAIAVSTVLLLVFGEVTPKTFAVRHAERLARVVAPPLLVFAWAILPVRFVLRQVTNALLFVLRRGRLPAEPLLTRREIAAALEVGEAEGAIAEHEREILEHIIEFRQLDARELMVPRTEMVCVDEKATVAEAVDLVRRSGHTRLPVHSGDVDAIWGIFDVRDLPGWRDRDILGRRIKDFVEDERLKEPKGRRPLVRPAFLVPETRHAGDLLRDMRDSGSQMAILLDEYGGTSGLVTLRQLADELVGRALVKATGGAPFFRIVESRLRLLGEARVRDVNRELGLDLTRARDHFVGNGMDEETWQAILADPDGFGQGGGHQGGGCGSCKAEIRSLDLDETFDYYARRESDFNQHFPKLRELASRCKHVTECGSRDYGVIALLAGRPEVLRSYNTQLDGAAFWKAEQLAKTLQTKVRITHEPPELAEIDETDLLFYDPASHTAEQTAGDLLRLADRVRRYIVLHDTEVFGVTGSDGGPGIKLGLIRLMRERPEWTVVHATDAQYGLMVLSRDPADKPKRPSVVKMGPTFLKHLAEHVADGLEKVTPEQFQARLETCWLCDLRTANQQCSLCGCDLVKKAGWRSSRCDANKWDETGRQQQETVRQEANK